MANCIYCGKPAGFFYSRHPECERLHDNGTKELRSLATGALTAKGELEDLPARAQQIAKEAMLTETQVKEVLVGAWSEAVNHFTDLMDMDQNTEDQLVQFKKAFALSQQDLDQNQAFTKLSKAMVLQDIARGKIPTRIHVANQLALNFEKDEIPVWLFTETRLLEDKQFRHYEGASAGFSVRVVKGVYYHTSAFKGQPIEQTERVLVDEGTLVFTNKNISFVGSRKGFKIPFRKVMSFQPFSDGIGLIKEGGNSKLQCAITGDGWFTYNLAVGLAHAAGGAAS